MHCWKEISENHPPVLHDLWLWLLLEVEELENLSVHEGSYEIALWHGQNDFANLDILLGKETFANSASVSDLDFLAFHEEV